MKRFPSHTPRRKGAVLMMVVFTLLALGAVATTMGGFVSTTHVESGTAITARQAFYAAEAGVRIAAAEYNNSAASTDRSELLDSLSGKTFNLTDDGSQQFDLNVYSYGFRVASHDADTNTIVAKAIGNIPTTDLEDLSAPTISFPAGTMISVQDEIGNDTPATLTSDGAIDTYGDGNPTVTFTYQDPAGSLPLGASGDLDFVGIAQHTTAGVGGNAVKVTGLPETMNNYPRRNGRIAIYGEDMTYAYRKLTVEADDSVSLEGLTPESGSFALSDFQDKTLILRKTFGFQSIGRVTTAGKTATKLLAYYDSPNEDITIPDPDADVAGPDDTMENLEGFENADEAIGSDTVLRIGSYRSSQGDHVYYAALYSGQGNDIGDHSVRLKYSNFSDHWALDERLSYDVQIKLGFGYQLPFGAAGISIRHHRQKTGNRYNCYGISFMKYYGGGDRPNYEDYIPDDMKPYRTTAGDLGTHVDDWDNNQPTPTRTGEDDIILLVFWRQEGNTREWIAYKDVTDDLGIFPKQWQYDGRIVSDNATMLVRAEEQFIQGTKVNRIKVFYGDGSEHPDVDYGGNGIPYDIIAGVLHNYNSATQHDDGRRRYPPSWTAAAGLFPKYPPLSIGDWTIAEDYFSFVENGVNYSVNGKTRLCRWDGVNSEVIAREAEADIRILSDGGTIRTKEFLTPAHASENGSPHNFPGNRAEVAIHAFGELDIANKAATYDDLSIRFLEYYD